MGRFVIAYDLGTSGNKASIYDTEGKCVGESFVPYSTHYPATGWHEQRPLDWWKAVIESTNRLLAMEGLDKNDIACCGISGHSLGVVPLDREGNVLRELISNIRFNHPNLNKTASITVNHIGFIHHSLYIN